MSQTPSPLANGLPFRYVVAFPYRCVVAFPARSVVAFPAWSEARVVGALTWISNCGPQVQNFPLVSTSI